MKRTELLTAVVLLLALGLAVGCGDDDNDAPTSIDGSIAGDGDGDGDIDAPIDPIDPTIAAISERIFVRSCGFISCHDADNPEQGMDLITDPYSAIVGVDARIEGRILVIPGDPDKSYLLEKVERMMPQVGDQMPRGQPLVQHKLDAIRLWIKMGALPTSDDSTDAGEDAGI